jgi:hypothetical protein
VFGIQGDVPVASDFDGDGRDNIALYRPSTGIWYRSTDAARNYDAVQWGVPGDRPVIGDFDGDGRGDPAVVRFGSTAVWYILGTTSGPQAQTFGAPGDRPAPVHTSRDGATACAHEIFLTQRSRRSRRCLFASSAVSAISALGISNGLVSGVPKPSTAKPLIQQFRGWHIRC